MVNLLRNFTTLSGSPPLFNYFFLFYGPINISDSEPWNQPEHTRRRLRGCERLLRAASKGEKEVYDKRCVRTGSVQYESQGRFGQDPILEDFSKALCTSSSSLDSSLA